jgi:hypothetical protein
MGARPRASFLSLAAGCAPAADLFSARGRLHRAGKQAGAPLAGGNIARSPVRSSSYDSDCRSAPADSRAAARGPATCSSSPDRSAAAAGLAMLEAGVDRAVADGHEAECIARHERPDARLLRRSSPAIARPAYVDLSDGLADAARRSPRGSPASCSSRRGCPFIRRESVGHAKCRRRHCASRRRHETELLPCRSATRRFSAHARCRGLAARIGVHGRRGRVAAHAGGRMEPLARVSSLLTPWTRAAREKGMQAILHMTIHRADGSAFALGVVIGFRRSSAFTRSSASRSRSCSPEPVSGHRSASGSTCRGSSGRHCRRDVRRAWVHGTPVPTHFLAELDDVWDLPGWRARAEGLVHLLQPLLAPFAIGSTIGSIVLGLIAYRVALAFVIARRRRLTEQDQPAGQ